MASQAPTQNLPMRSSTNEDAVPDEDSSEVTKLFNERLQAYKHACAYLEDYVEATEKLYKDNSKDYDKVLKTVSSPLKEGHHFDQNLGGIAGLFDNLRTNTQGIANSSDQTAKTLKGSVLPIFERLHTEIKNKQKELEKGAGKGSKAVDKSRNATQKHIELLGQHTAAHDSHGGSVKAENDPYILHRQVYHRLNKQIIEENNNRDDMISVQNNFSQFEASIIQGFQNGIAQFNQVVANDAEQRRNMYGDVTRNAQQIPAEFEWNGFVKRNAGVLIDPSAPKRTVESVGFANQDHRATKPLIAGSLERKSGLLKKYDAGFYVVTPSKYLHEFKTDDDFAKDPTPENSLYLPDSLIGAVDGVKFNVRGKDSSGSSVANKLARSKEFAFKAHTPADAEKWHAVISSVAGQSTNERPESDPGSPASPSAAGGVVSGGLSTHPGHTGTEGIPAQAGAPGVATHAGAPGVATSTGAPGVATTTGAPGVATTGDSGYHLHSGSAGVGGQTEGVINPPKY